MRHPDFLELTVCDNCDLATANESMSLLITSFVSDGITSSNVSNQTLLTAADERIITSSLHHYYAIMILLLHHYYISGVKEVVLLRSRELISLITRGRKEVEKMWAGIRFLDKATPRLRPVAVWISTDAVVRLPYER